MIIVIAGCATGFWYYWALRGYFTWDEWEFWKQRASLGGADYFLKPYNGSLNAGLFAIWGLIDARFGARSYIPYVTVNAVFFFCSLGLVGKLAKTLGLRSVTVVCFVAVVGLNPVAHGNFWGGWQLAWNAAKCFGLITMLLGWRQHWLPALAAFFSSCLAICFAPPGVVLVLGAMYISFKRKFYRHTVAVGCSLALYGFWYVSWQTAASSFAPHRGVPFMVIGIVTSFSEIFALSQATFIGWSVGGFLVYRSILPPHHRSPLAERPEPAKLTLLILLLWWAMLAVSRSDLAFDPQTAGAFLPTTPRYVDVALPFALLAVVLTFRGTTRHKAWAVATVSILAIPMILIGSKRGLQQEKYASGIKNSINQIACGAEPAQPLGGFGTPSKHLILNLVKTQKLVCDD